MSTGLPIATAAKVKRDASIAQVLASISVKGRAPKTGFSTAPIGAKVSIVNNDGTAQVATTVITEKDGFFRMGAYGFGFSSPTIKMKITQSASAASSTGGRSTITCVKGRTSKKVTSVNPICPSGYKKR